MDSEHQTRYDLIEDSCRETEIEMKLTDRNEQVKTIYVHDGETRDTCINITPWWGPVGVLSMMMRRVGESYHIISYHIRLALHREIQLYFKKTFLA